MRDAKNRDASGTAASSLAAAITAVGVAICAAEAAAIVIVAVTRPPADAPAGASGLPPAAELRGAGDGLPDGAGPVLAAMIVGDAVMAPCWADYRIQANC